MNRSNQFQFSSTKNVNNSKISKNGTSETPSGVCLDEMKKKLVSFYCIYGNRVELSRWTVSVRCWLRRDEKHKRKCREKNENHLDVWHVHSSHSVFVHLCTMRTIHSRLVHSAENNYKLIKLEQIENRLARYRYCDLMGHLTMREVRNVFFSPSSWLIVSD